MARSECVVPMRGSAVRFVQTDQCGRVQYGTCSAFNTTAVRSLNFSSDTDEGDEVSIQNIAGDRCVYVAPTPQNNGHELEVNFCRYDPLLFSRLMGCEPITNEDGIAVGHVECESAGTQDAGMAMAIWMRVYVDRRDNCRGGNRFSTRYLVRIVPWTTRWIPGDMELSEGGEDGVPLNFSGHSQLGVLTDLAGIVGGPVEPLNVPNESNHSVWVVTSVPPPRDECGCTEVVRPVPNPATIYVQRDAGSTDRAQVWVDNQGLGPVTLDCGIDGSTREVEEFETVTCTYPEDGTYTIRACDVQTPAVCATRDVTIPLPPDNPELEIEADSSDPNGLTILMSIDNHGNGPVDVTWRPGEQKQRIENPDGTEQYAHTYPRPGVYQIEVVDVDEPERKSTEVAVLPVAATPVFTLTGGQGELDVEVHGDDANQPEGGRSRTFYIQWGDGTPRTSTKLTAADVVAHTYEDMGTYTVTVSDMASPLARRSQEITLPVPGDRPGPPGQTSMSWEPADQPGPPGVTSHTWEPVDQPGPPGQTSMTWEEPATTRTRKRS